jgi:hypothetical protein
MLQQCLEMARIDSHALCTCRRCLESTHDLVPPPLWCCNAGKSVEATIKVDKRIDTGIRLRLLIMIRLIVIRVNTELPVDEVTVEAFILPLA